MFEANALARIDNAWYLFEYLQNKTNITHFGMQVVKQNDMSELEKACSDLSTNQMTTCPE